MSKSRGRRGRRNRTKATFSRPAGTFVVPSLATLAEQCGISVEEARRTVAEAVELGWVAVPVIPADDHAPVRGHLTVPAGVGR